MLKVIALVLTNIIFSAIFKRVSHTPRDDEHWGKWTDDEADYDWEKEDEDMSKSKVSRI